jgi:hypothetical protein
MAVVISAISENRPLSQVVDFWYSFLSDVEESREL